MQNAFFRLPDILHTQKRSAVPPRPPSFPDALRGRARRMPDDRVDDEGIWGYTKFVRGCAYHDHGLIMTLMMGPLRALTFSIIALGKQNEDSVVSSFL